MKILLVNPPIPRKFRMLEYADEAGKKSILRRVMVGPPLGLNELAGMIPEEDVIILDQKAELDADPNYNHLEALIKEINEFKPEFVAITCLTAQYNSVMGMLEAIKNYDNKILTSVGGIHPSLCPEDFIGSKADIISIGIGKLSFYQIVQEFKKNKENADFSNIAGLALNKGDSLHFTKPLSEVSYDEFQECHMLENILPNRALTDKYDYRISRMDNKKIQYLSTSLGCTHKCNFCTVWPLTDGRYFHRDVESIISELKLMDEYPIIRFCDANTFGNVEKVRQLFNRIIEEGLNNHFYIADVRTDTVIRHPDLIKLAAKAGLKVTICGLEATSDEELKKYGKQNSIDTTREALRILNEAGIWVNGNYIVRPDFVEEDFDRVASFVTENPIYHAGFTILTPFPGTEQWEELKDQVVIKDYDYYNLTNAVLETKLPEREFYNKLSELYKTSAKATEKYFSIYGNPDQTK
ncbi:B12-binding domain-containing radical SAM protein [Clostridium sp. DJ247]|uniref:B12-binding domain-containing radical SAM protein n=1 Tax=Clostridium sp. DJ247 TaxID=2726188 RepID=UPI0016265DA1|nr:radical SAM protein [Clostridium sp. DJ247]MBC2581427.1 B12-binding domain-containing radical SAM protein [Clostridium sp. DJ247]